MHPQSESLSGLLDGSLLSGAELRDEPEEWPVRRTDDVWRGRAPFAVRVDEITLPQGGAPFSRVVVEHPGAVVVLALDEQDRVLVLRQYRHAAKHRFVELPAGLLDQEQEDPRAAAERELLEEAGLLAESWEHLATVHNSPGFTSERIVFFLARALRQADRGDFVLEHEEADMTLHWAAYDELLAAALDGRTGDGPLVTALLLVQVRFRSGTTPTV